MPLDQLLQEKREDILRIASKWDASNVRVFGSVVRGEFDSKSDIDQMHCEKRSVKIFIT